LSHQLLTPNEIELQPEPPAAAAGLAAIRVLLPVLQDSAPWDVLIPVVDLAAGPAAEQALAAAASELLQGN